ncbi:MAG TPA: A/G-specific adenine glycosylase [Gemmatimonadota bacterium]|nr:A/G-specific adenine glycosylase [Gemmatimonadota bacterium]
MLPPDKADRVAAIRRRLLEFFDREKRVLPWRVDRDPYRVWVSEVMLQQTRVETVIPYYVRWLARFPDLPALAAAERDAVLEAWAGLGYYSRARNLHDAARVVRDALDGEIPSTAEGLRALPGVGPYVAGAVASIAFGRAEPAVDGNARRVLARLFDLDSPTDRELRERAAELVPEDRPGDFNQALMELGATVCVPRSPRCGECPLESLCRSRARGTVESRPPPRRRPAVPTFRIGTAVVVSPAGRALLARRREDGLLGGMWEFPGAEAGRSPARAARALAERLVGDAFGDRPARRIDRVDHLFSHRRHVYHAYLFRPGHEAEPTVRADWTAAEWVAIDRLDGRALPAAQRRIAAALAEAVRC